MKIQDQTQLMNKIGFNIEKKIKYVIIANTNCTLFESMLRHGMK